MNNNKISLSVLSELYIKLSKSIADTIDKGIVQYKEGNPNATNTELLVSVADPVILSVLSVAVQYMMQIGFSKKSIIKDVEAIFDDYISMGIGTNFSPLKEDVVPKPTQDEIKLPEIDKPKSSGWNVN